jgi:hypothetical protein
VLSLGNPWPVGYHYRLKVAFEGTSVLTGALDGSETADDIVVLLQSAVDTLEGDYTVALANGVDGGADPAADNVYFSVTDDSATGLQTSVFLGEILAVDDLDPDSWSTHARCYPDCAVLSFRRSAGLMMRVEDLTLKGDDDGEDVESPRYACFGVLFTTTQFEGHVLERTRVSFCDTAVGLLQGTGANGEWVRLSRLRCDLCRRGYYSNAPQAFLQEFDGWWLGLDNDGVFAEFAHMGLPGVGVNFNNAHCTFGGGGNPDGDGTMVKVFRGTGVVRFDGGRVEHMARLFDYDAVDGQGANDDMDVILRGMEFEGVRGGSDRTFVMGDQREAGATLGTNYGLTVQDCKVAGYGNAQDPVYGNSDLNFASMPQDQIRCLFERCRFIGVRSFRMTDFRADFVRCHKNDYIADGAAGYTSPLRLFEQSQGTPGPRTQSTRTVFQDTPFAQSGPRVNILRSSDFTGQAEESANADDLVSISTGGSFPWHLEEGLPLGEFVFGKWGAFDEADIDMSPVAFYVALTPADGEDTFPQVLYNDLDAFDLSGDATKVATYQALARVMGKVRFALVNSDDESVVYDQVAIDSQDAFTDLTQVTLRGQLKQDAGETHFRLRVENLLTTGGTGNYARFKFLSQQAWGGKEGDETYPLELGLANSTLVSTPDDAPAKNTYPWSVNALSVMAQSRLRIPAKTSRYGWDQRGLIGTPEADLRDGDVYYDETQFALLMVMNEQMFTVHQPERIDYRSASFTWSPANHHQKNIVVADTDSIVLVSLENDTDVVPDGTVVRVYHNTTATNTVSVRFGTSGATTYSIASGHSSEFVFVGGAWRSTYHDVAYVAQ